VHEYDLIADWYASERTDQTGVPEAIAMASSLAPGARILDIGCGNGIPITRALLRAGHRVVGIDSSERMLSRFRGNLSDTPVVRGLVQRCAFCDGTFDAAVAWGVIFHLPLADQASAFASVSRVLKRGAPFLFTAGEAEGVDEPDGTDPGIEGTMNGVTFHYYALSIEGYRRLLDRNRLALVDVHTDAGKNAYYLARKCA